MSHYRFIAAEKAHYPIRNLCRVVTVSRAAYYQWLEEKPYQHQLQDEAFLVHIKAIWRRSRQTYGYPQITRELRAQGLDVGRRRVIRLMRENGIVGIPQRKFDRTSAPDSEIPPAENLLNRQFTATAPNTAWVTDITYLPNVGDSIYLAVLIDLFSRKVVGWALDSHMRTDLCLTALSRAVAARQPAPGPIHHSDRGSQYCSGAYQQALSELGAVVSMSRKGNCWDNAVAESFFGTLEQELVLREGPWANPSAAHAAVSDYPPLLRRAAPAPHSGPPEPHRFRGKHIDARHEPRARQRPHPPVRSAPPLHQDPRALSQSMVCQIDVRSVGALKHLCTRLRSGKHPQ